MAPLAANLRERRLGLGIAVSEGAISSSKLSFLTARILFNWLVLERCARGQSADFGRSASVVR